MDATTQPQPTDLPRSGYHHLVHTLRTSLPPPLTDAPEELARRDHAAIAQVAGLCPANTAEASLAAQYVAANAYAMDCLRLAHGPEIAIDVALKCGAQAASMMRQAQGAMRLLLRVQTARRKLEADNGAADKAAWTEHCAVQLMAEALPEAERFSPAPPPVVEPEPPAAAADEPEQPASPVAAPIAEAEFYAQLYPRRAALIRRLGRVPEDASFGPPGDELVRALVTTHTPTLQALDRLAV